MVTRGARVIRVARKSAIVRPWEFDYPGKNVCSSGTLTDERARCDYYGGDAWDKSA